MRGIHTGASVLEHEAGAGFSAQEVAHSLGGLARQVLPVDFKEDIARLQSRLLCRHAFIRGIDDDVVLLLVEADDGADAGELAGSHHLQFLVLALGVVDSVGVQLGEHVVDAVLDRLPRVDGVDVAEVQFAEDGVEDVEVFGNLEVARITLKTEEGAYEHEQPADHQQFLVRQFHV